MRAVNHFDEVYLILSDQAIDVARTELGVQLSKANFSTVEWLGKQYDNLILCGDKDYFTPPASGSFMHDGMVIVLPADAR